jgi:chromosomal replication initiation ATPase DnaA
VGPKNSAEARQVALLLTRTRAKRLLVQMSNEFGARDHGTVNRACKHDPNRITGSNDFKRPLDSIAGKIHAS